MRPRILGLGEILWDLLPAGKQLGGATANFAYHAHTLGADARIISRVGNDPLGAEILDRLKSLGLPTDGVDVDRTAPTGTVSVDVDAAGQPRYTVHRNVAWDRIAIQPASRVLADTLDAVCFGSLAQRDPVSRQSILETVAITPRTTLRIFDINLRQNFYSREIVETSIVLCDALKLNDAELPALTDMFGLTGDTRGQLSQLSARFGLRAIAFTRGQHGSLLLSGERWSDHPGSPVKVVDAVGAGDAFTAAWAMGILKGVDLDRINERANAIAAFVCTQAGATPPMPAELVAFV